MIKFIKKPKKGDKVKCHSKPPRYGIVESVEVGIVDEKETEIVLLKECEPFDNSVKNYYLEPNRCKFKDEMDKS